VESELTQWPIQIKLVPVKAPYYDGANLLVAADCTAFAYGDFHRKLIRGRVCADRLPEALTRAIIPRSSRRSSENNIKSVTVARMEVPCCGGLENAVKARPADSSAASLSPGMSSSYRPTVTDFRGH
jgi:hypothetical protein